MTVEQEIEIEEKEPFTLAWSDGDKLRKVRRHLGLNQREMAKVLGVTFGRYASWEGDRNRMKDPRKMARRLKMLAGVPMWWFLDTEPPAGPEDWPTSGNVRPEGFEPPTFCPAVQLAMTTSEEGAGQAA
jgi:transcriptional regulator with XRE-family HTH domain